MDCTSPAPKGDLFCLHCVRLSYIEQFTVSESLKACLEMVLFADRSLLASREKLLCLVMNLPNCGCSEEPTRSLTPCYPEDGGSTFSKTLASQMASHSKRW
jgi:hypothetical protein